MTKTLNILARYQVSNTIGGTVHITVDIDPALLKENAEAIKEQVLEQARTAMDSYFAMDTTK